MTKQIKKIVSICLVAVMLMMSAATVFAEEGNAPENDIMSTITVPGNGHTYEVYQIFTGTLFQDENEQFILSDVKWGQNGKGTVGTEVDAAVLEALQEVNVEGKSNQDKLAVIKQYINTGSQPVAVLGGESSESTKDVPHGYYLIKDKDDSLSGKDEAYTTYIVELKDDITITPKSATPTVDKQVWDEPADAETELQDGWGETADHAIYETFQFKLTADLPDEEAINDYQTYTLVFTDSMTAGVTFAGNVQVSVNGSMINETNYVVDDKAVEGSAGITWTLTIEDLKTLVGDAGLKGAKVEVTYDAYLNGNAAVGNQDDNKNTVVLQYSNNPNRAEETEQELGKTPEDTVWVFTYGLENKKVDATDTNRTLQGAEFKLYSSQTCEAVDEIKLIKQSEGIYRPVKSEENGEVMVSDGNGRFDIVGLDVGTYYLKETKAPDGYNTLKEPIEITITAVHEENSDKISANTNITYTKKNSKDKAVSGFKGALQIENSKGITLPSTGSMGTTLFYVFGGLLVIVSTALLITRRRMRNGK